MKYLVEIQVINDILERFMVFVSNLLTSEFQLLLKESSKNQNVPETFITTIFYIYT